MSALLDSGAAAAHEAALRSAQHEAAEYLARFRQIGLLDGHALWAGGTVVEDPSVPGTDGDGEGIVRTIHFVRHGQGFHNLLADVYRANGKSFSSLGDDFSDSCPYRRHEIRDAPLTEIGRQQAMVLRPAARALRPELVVVSPLSRAVQTALLAFDHLRDGPEAVPFVAHGGVQEQGGVQRCDHRRPIAEIAREFPSLDLSALAPLGEADPLWNETKREPYAALCARARAFFEWLGQRPEREVAVVGHSAWLFTVLNAVLAVEGEAAPHGEGARRWFLTGELRTLRVRFRTSEL
ncbi:histidine phosphatase superfamily [Pavlovales sp. CCMP2436]|nr:histidine phosphatase superfamily [Pavlovales sp. CCMP2436]